jgi:hypothetical protein
MASQLLDARTTSSSPLALAPRVRARHRAVGEAVLIVIASVTGLAALALAVVAVFSGFNF